VTTEERAMKLHELPPTITVEEAGRLLGISRRSAYRAAARGQIPSFKIGRRLLVPTPALLAMLRQVGAQDRGVEDVSVA
jgi:excisionase family DNA binding protein